MKLRILIVEDAPEIVACLSDVIDFSRFEVFVALNFDSAQELLKSETFDLVVTDFDFPGGDGNLVALLARHCGIKKVVLHTGDPTSKKILVKLYNNVFGKLDQEMIEMLGAA